MSENEKKQGGGLAEQLTRMLGLKPQQANMVKMIAIAVAIGILFLNAGPLFGVTENTRRPPDATEVVAPASSVPQDELHALEQEMAAKLERTLSQIQGAGQVTVSVTLEAGPIVTPLQNVQQQKTTTNEQGPDGSTRVIETVSTDTSSVMSKSGSEDVPAIASRGAARVAGVLIVAEGARSTTVKARIHESAWRSLGVAAHKVKVVPAEGR